MLARSDVESAVPVQSGREGRNDFDVFQGFPRSPDTDPEVALVLEVGVVVIQSYLGSHDRSRSLS